MAKVAYNDPFYISQIVCTNKADLDLTTEEGVRAALQFETTCGKGFVAKIWMEYIAEGLARANDMDSKKIVLYLVKHGKKECTRDQIHRDLKLDISEDQLADRLYKLEKADLIQKGSSAYHYKGLADPIFAAVFSKHFAEEIERVSAQKFTENFEQEMLTLTQACTPERSGR